MKKLIILVLALMLCACGHPKTIDGITYDTYGLLNQDTKKNENIEYELIAWNVIWSIVFCETVLVPVYFVGFDIYEPIGPKVGYIKGKIN